MRHGSVQNLFASQSVQTHDAELPKVGDGATIVGWSDRHAATVIEVRPGKRPVVIVQDDKAIRTDDHGMSDCQSYRFERNPNGMTREVRFNKARRRHTAPHWNAGGQVVMFGVRDHYYDFSF